MKRVYRVIFIYIIFLSFVFLLPPPICADGKRFEPVFRKHYGYINPSSGIKYPTETMEKYKYCVDSGSKKVFQSYIAPTQQAVIAYKNGIETLIIEVAPLPDPEFAWVVPVPSYPEVKKEESNFLTAFSNCTFFQLFGSFRAMEYNASMGLVVGPDDIFYEINPNASPSPSVIVHEKKLIGAFDTAILSADQPDALVKWLNDNNYRFPENGRDTVDFYVQRKWFFVAMKVANPEKLTKMHPVRFEFKTSRPVYPMRLTALEDGISRVNLYVFADHEIGVQGGHRIWRGTSSQLTDVDDQYEIIGFTGPPSGVSEVDIKQEIARKNKERLEFRKNFKASLRQFPSTLTVINYEIKNDTIQDDLYLEKMSSHSFVVNLRNRTAYLPHVAAMLFFLFFTIVDPARWIVRRKKSKDTAIEDSSGEEATKQEAVEKDTAETLEALPDTSLPENSQGASAFVSGKNSSRVFPEILQTTKRLLLSFVLSVVIIFIPVHLLVTFNQNAIDDKNTEKCLSNMKSIGTALEMYSTDYSGHYPVSFDHLTPGYLDSIPTCPGAKKEVYSATYHSDKKPDAYTFYCSYRHPLKGMTAGLVVFPACGEFRVVQDTGDSDTGIKVW